MLSHIELAQPRLLQRTKKLRFSAAEQQQRSAADLKRHELQEGQ